MLYCIEAVTRAETVAKLRQLTIVVVFCVSHPMFLAIMFARSAATLDSMFAQSLSADPVSYTHLDVYKRQTMGSAATFS